MPTPFAQYSTDNVTNSVATALAQALLTAGYLVYWLQSDALQTTDGWYLQYREQQTALAADAQLQTQIAAATGLVTLRPPTTANPTYPTRPSSDGLVPAASDAPVPNLAVDVGPVRNGRNVGLGDTTKYRSRQLSIFGAARDDSEMVTLRDFLAETFDNDTTLDVQNHDDQTLDLVGTVQFTLVMTDSARVEMEQEAARFEVILNARLTYEA